MKKQFLIVAIMAILGIFLSYDSGAQGWKRGHHKHYYKEQRRAEKAYRHGYYQGARQAYRDDCRPPRRYYVQRPYRGRGHYRPYRQAQYRPYYAPRPYVSGGVSINIPLPPHPPLPPLP